MNYWKMQLHPDDSRFAMRHTMECLGAQCIGLDFEHDPGDLRFVKRTDISPTTQQRYHDFASKMADDDSVLIYVRNRPFALVVVRGPYNYSTTPSDFGVWFRHYRRINAGRIGYWGDRTPEMQATKVAPMPGTIQIINSDDPLHRVITEWRQEIS